jgi:lysophospholipase L1-like esterase
MAEPDVRPTGHPQRESTAAGYIVGLLTGVVVMGLVLVYVGYSVCGPEWARKLNPWRDMVDVPPEVLSELGALDAVFSNTRKHLAKNEHDTILVRPDDEMVSVLRPDVQIAVNMLRTTRPLNLDPPVLHYPADNPVPENVARYLERETRLSYHYSTDHAGYRTTLPAVESEEQILMVGDSVLFGVGVDDKSTIASQLQRSLGDRYRIVNAGVGDYDGRQAAAVAERLSRERTWAGLVYVACRNDFTEYEDWNGEAAAILERLSALRERFSGNIVVVLHTYMEYTLHDFFLDRGEKQEFTDGIHALRPAVAQLAEQHGFEFVDWTDQVNRYMRKSGSVFAPFALYVDHCHLSPLGNRLLAKGVAARIERRLAAIVRLQIPHG